MHFSLLPVAAILPTLPTVTTPSDLMHGAIEFFNTWIARIGGIVALIGMIKFALSIKNEDARESLTKRKGATGDEILEALEVAMYMTGPSAMIWTERIDEIVNP